MKRFLYSVAAIFVAMTYVGCNASAQTLLDGAVLEVQKADKTEDIVLQAIKEKETVTENKGFDVAEVDYSKVWVETSLRSGGAAADANILDIVSAKLIGTDEVVSYRWQGSMDGVNWSAIDGETTNEYWLTYDAAYKYVRCVIKAGRLSFRGEKIEIPTRKMAAPAWAEGDASHHLGGERENSNPDYIFKLDGKGFVLLEDFDNPDAAFYVTTTESYGDAINASTGAKQGVPSSKSVSAHGIYTVAGDGSYIGQLLTTIGNNYTFFGEDHDTMYTLPDGIVKHISEDVMYPFWSSSWLQNRHFYKSPKAADVWMLAWDDFIRYSGRLGFKDNVFDAGGNSYFTRDGSPIDGWYANCMITDTGSSACIKNAVGVIRPAFFLSEEFFKSVKLDDLSSVGKGVIEIMKNRYTPDELSSLYSVSELAEAGISGQVSGGKDILTAENVSFKDATSVLAKVTLKNDTDEDFDAISAFMAYDKAGKLTDVKLVSQNVAAGGTAEANCNVHEWVDMADVNKLNVFAWAKSLPGQQ